MYLSIQNCKKLTPFTKYSHWLNPPWSVQRTHYKFSKFQNLCTKECGHPLLKNPIHLCPKISTLDNPLPLTAEVIYLPEVAARTQPLRPRPRTLKKSEAKAKDRVAENSLPQGQEQKGLRLEVKAKDSRTRLKIRANINVNIAKSIATILCLLHPT